MLSFNVSASYARSGVRDCARVCFPVFMCLHSFFFLRHKCGTRGVDIVPPAWEGSGLTPCSNVQIYA